MRKYKDLLVLSNLVYVIVGVIGVWLVGYYALPILAVSIASTLYHKSGETQFQLRDIVLARLSIVSNSLLLLQDYFDLITITGSLILFVVGGLYYLYASHGRSKRYELYHAMWHIISGCATLLIFIGYAI